MLSSSLTFESILHKKLVKSEKEGETEDNSHCLDPGV